MGRKRKNPRKVRGARWAFGRRGSSQIKPRIPYWCVRGRLRGGRGNLASTPPYGPEASAGADRQLRRFIFMQRLPRGRLANVPEQRNGATFKVHGDHQNVDVALPFFPLRPIHRENQRG